jgi:tetratricopeptide (TPR) repeat protein
VTGRTGGSGLLIKLAAAAGLLLAAAICAVLVMLALRPQRDALPGGRFYRLLRDYDRIRAGGGGEKGGRPEALESALDRIEKNVQGVESWLSLLKRRRALAAAFPRMLPQYQGAARRAAKAFPGSEPLAALALACSLQGNGEISRSCGGRINDARFIPLALAAAVLRGDFGDPRGAAKNQGEELLAAALPLIGPGLSEGRRDRLIVNLALLRILRRDYPGAEAQLQGLSPAASQQAFLGEYYYDFGDPLRAAEIFSRTGGEGGLLRSADALWLGGKAENAGNIWRTLGITGPEGRLRSFYNLAAAFPEESGQWLDRLRQAGEEESALRGDPAYVCGLIGYTRNLLPLEAVEFLDSRLRALDSPDLAALRDLEILRRRGELWVPERTAAEAWLLLGIYPEDPRLYRWAAWHFSYQRRWDEGTVLVKAADYRGIKDPWLDLCAALNDLEGGRQDRAEEGLRSILSGPGGSIWQAEADLGLILEARRAPAEALKHYENAAGRAGNRRAASRLQQRIAGCLRSLGRKEESRRALLRSLELNPGNLAARLELRRMEEQAGIPGPG